MDWYSWRFKNLKEFIVVGRDLPIYGNRSGMLAVYSASCRRVEEKTWVKHDYVFFMIKLCLKGEY